MMMWGPGISGWGMIGMLIYGLFWIAVLAGGFFLIVRLFQQGGPQRANLQGESAMEVLKRRYAAGEISREEFERIRLDLKE